MPCHQHVHRLQLGDLRARLKAAEQAAADAEADAKRAGSKAEAAEESEGEARRALQESEGESVRLAREVAALTDAAAALGSHVERVGALRQSRLGGAGCAASPWFPTSPAAFVLCAARLCFATRAGT